MFARCFTSGAIFLKRAIFCSIHNYFKNHAAYIFREVSRHISAVSRQIVIRKTLPFLVSTTAYRPDSEICPSSILCDRTYFFFKILQPGTCFMRNSHRSRLKLSFRSLLASSTIQRMESSLHPHFLLAAALMTTIHGLSFYEFISIF